MTPTIRNTTRPKRTTAMQPAHGASSHGWGNDARSWGKWQSEQLTTRCGETAGGFRRTLLRGDQPLAACQELATGSAMNHLMGVLGTATTAFDELARATEALTPSRKGQTEE